MDKQIADKIGDAIIEVGKKVKAGTSELTSDEAMQILSLCVREPMCREEVCDYLNVNNTKFYELITLGHIPKGKKRRGFKELVWYKDEVDAALNTIRNRK